MGMLALSAASVALIVLGFLLNDRVPFEEPISLLIQGPHPWAYHAILVSLILTLCWYTWQRFRSAGGPWGLALSCLALLILVFLLFVDFRVQPAHDKASAFLLFLCSIFLSHLSIELGWRYLRLLVSLSFVVLPLLFTNDLTAMALVELVLLAWSLVIFNLAFYRRPRLPEFPRIAFRDLVASGSRMRGHLWACYCVFFSGIAEVYRSAPVAGVLHFALCWWAGFLTRRYAPYPLVNNLLLLSSGVGSIFLMSAFAEVRAPSVILATIPIAGAVALIGTYRWQSAKLGY